MLILLFFGTGAWTGRTESVAVVDNDKQQLLMDSKELSATVYGGCDDGRVINCRTLPLFNYTDLTPPPVGPDATADILQDQNCPSVQRPRWPPLPVCSINDYGGGGGNNNGGGGGHYRPPAAVAVDTDYRYICLILVPLSLLILYTDNFYLYFLLLLTLLLSFVTVAVVIAVLYCLLLILLMSFIVVIFILALFTALYYRRLDANR